MCNVCTIPITCIICATAGYTQCAIYATFVPSASAQLYYCTICTIYNECIIYTTCISCFIAACAQSAMYATFLPTGSPALLHYMENLEFIYTICFVPFVSVVLLRDTYMHNLQYMEDLYYLLYCKIYIICKVCTISTTCINYITTYILHIFITKCAI